MGAAAVFLAWGIPVSGLGANHDPGPRLFPLILGFILIGGAVWEWTRGWRRSAGEAKKAISEMPEVVAEMEAEPGAEEKGFRNFLLLAVSFFVYLLGLSWAGFFPATWVYATVMMWLWGTRLLVAGGASLVLLLTVYGLFVRLFKVPLP